MKGKSMKDEKVRPGVLTLSLPLCSAEADATGLDEDTLSRLVEVLSIGDVSWKKLAEKLGMMTLTHLYMDSPTPCQQLLQHYKVTQAPRILGNQRRCTECKYH